MNKIRRVGTDVHGDTFFGTDISALQREIFDWGVKNFGNTLTPVGQFLGQIEELGEGCEFEITRVLKEVLAMNRPDFSDEESERFKNLAEANKILCDMLQLGRRTHRLLKRMQRVRDGGFEDNEFEDKSTEESAMDAVGDRLIFTLGYCALRGWSADRILSSTWEKVRERDWKRFPKNGVTE